METSQSPTIRLVTTQQWGRISDVTHCVTALTYCTIVFTFTFTLFQTIKKNQRFDTMSLKFKA